MSEQFVLVTSRGLCQIAALAWFVYDYFLTLEDEVEHIWFRKFNFTSFLYFWARMLSFVMLMIGAVQATRTYELSPLQCEIFHWVEGMGTVLIFVNTQIVLQYRLWILYGRNMKILLLNGVLFVLEAAASIIVCSIYYAHQARAEVPSSMSGLAGETCTTVAQREMALVFLSVLVYELWLAGMALLRTVQGRKGKLMHVTGQRTLTEVIGYDSVMYFTMIVLSAFVVIMVWSFAPLYPGNAIICFTRAASGIGASRLILHMRMEVKARDQASYSRPECIGVSLQLDTSAVDSPCRLVRAKPSFSTHYPSEASAPSPRPSFMSMFSSSRHSPNSSVSGETRRGSASSSEPSPRPSLAAISVSTHESPLFYGGSPQPSIASMPHGHAPRPSTSSTASSFYTPRPSVTSLAALTPTASGSSNHAPWPSFSVSPRAETSTQRSPPRDFFLDLPPV